MHQNHAPDVGWSDQHPAVRLGAEVPGAVDGAVVVADGLAEHHPDARRAVSLVVVDVV